MLTEKQAQLLLDRNHAALATLRRDGTAHVTPLWVDWDGEHVVVNTVIGRVKERHIRADPRVSVMVQDEEDRTRYVSVTGTAVLVTEGAEEHIDAMARKYAGLERYPDAWRAPGERRVLVLITPLKVTDFNIDADWPQVSGGPPAA